MKHLLVLLLFVPGTLRAQTEADIDNIFASWNDLAVPGGAVSIIKEGQPIFARGYGSADLEHDIPIVPGTVFYIGSVSKQFVTFCLLLLEEQGKLGLDDDIHQYFPDFPDYGAPLTIRNFIHHTSGVRDYLTLLALKNRSYLDHITVDEVYNLIKQQEALNFRPGEQYLYSNSCYFMLAQVVEKASGKSIREFAHEEIFAPLGMNSSRFYDNNLELIRNRAFSYQKNGEGWDNLINRFDLVGSGGVYSTVEDLYLWDQNFYNNKLGKGGQAIIDKMHTDGLLNSGESSGYAFAIVNGTYKGLRTVSHSGSLAGYRSVQLRFPDQQFTVTILANRNDARVVAMAYQIADLYLSDYYEKAAAAKQTSQAQAKTIKLSERKMAGFAGQYWNSRIGFRAQISVRDNMLQYADRSGNYYFLPITDNEFIEKDNPAMRLRFARREDKNYSLTLVDRQEYILEPFEPVSYSTEELRDFTGAWYSRELDFTYHIKWENELLVLYLGTMEDDPLELVKKNTFKAGYLILNFDEAHQSFTMKAGRVQDLIFVRRR